MPNDGCVTGCSHKIDYSYIFLDAWKLEIYVLWVFHIYKVHIFLMPGAMMDVQRVVHI